MDLCKILALRWGLQSQARNKTGVEMLRKHGQHSKAQSSVVEMESGTWLGPDAGAARETPMGERKSVAQFRVTRWTSAKLKIKPRGSGREAWLGGLPGAASCLCPGSFRRLGAFPQHLYCDLFYKRPSARWAALNQNVNFLDLKLSCRDTEKRHREYFFK